MFCMNCGTELPELAKFCMSCGKAMKVDAGVAAAMATPYTKLVPASCTNCGSSLTVDADQKAAICPYCNSAYIVEQAIKNYQITINGSMNIASASINVLGANIDNLLLRAKKYEADGEYEKALEYYNDVLDMDMAKQEAREGVDRVEEFLANYIYYQEQTNSGFASGVLQLKKDFLVFASKKEKETSYAISSIHTLRKTMGCLGFMYEGKMGEISFASFNVSKWIEIICQAQRGQYPPFLGDVHKQARQYVMTHFTSKGMMAAIKYYKNYTGVSLADAKCMVEQLLQGK